MSPKEGLRKIEGRIKINIKEKKLFTRMELV